MRAGRPRRTTADLVKIDVEDAELEVLAGMRRLLAEVQPVVVCEMHGANREFCAAMQAAGYAVINLDGLVPVAAAGVNAHARAAQALSGFLPQGRPRRLCATLCSAVPSGAPDNFVIVATN